VTASALLVLALPGIVERRLAPLLGGNGDTYFFAKKYVSPRAVRE